nr:MAG TPA: hypothetical protein [Caudoviricetes sp.]
MLRYSTLYIFEFLLFRRCKDTEFYRNYQTFFEKKHIKTLLFNTKTCVYQIFTVNLHRK